MNLNPFVPDPQSPWGTSAPAQTGNSPWNTTTLIPQQPVYIGPPPTVAWDPRQEMMKLKMANENELILQLTKMATEMQDEKSREIVMGRIQEAEGRKMALILSNP